jgi:haloalkane dehalogenase
MSDVWFKFRDFVRDSEDLPVGFLVKAGCMADPGEEVLAAYKAPYPTPESKAGARAFPALVPTEPDAPGAAEGRMVADALREDDRPTLVLWADSDKALPLSVGESVSERLNYPAPTVIDDASHFWQEDAGARIGGVIAEWLGPAG